MTAFRRSLVAMLVLVSISLPAYGTELFQLTSSPAADAYPSWSADGSSIIFQSNRSGRYHIYKMSRTGTDLEQLTFGDMDDMHPQVSRDGSKIAFVSGTMTDEGLLSSSLETIPIDGGSRTTVIPDEGLIVWHPSWTPDDATIYYSCRHVRDGIWDWAIYKVASTGGPHGEISHFADEVYSDISPDGSRIVYSIRPYGGAYNLYEAPVTDPSQITQLTFESANTSSPNYSPDGIHLAYTSRKYNNKLDLYELNLQTKVSERLTFDGDNSGSVPYTQYPEYSHDGDWIAFSSARVSGDENIWILSRTGESPFGNVLSVGNGQGLPGGGAVRVPVSLECAQRAPALEFEVHDVPDRLTVTGVEVRDRGSNMTASFATNSGAHVVVYNPSGGMIPAGTGPILDLLVEVKQSADLGETIALDLSDIVLSDPSGSAVDADAVSGSFLVARLAGDLNGDNLVDVGDLVRLVEIILGTGHAPSADEMDLADCNEDGSVNALDIVCLLDAILNAAPPLTPASPALAGAGTDFVIRAEDEVRGLQITGSGLPGEDADLAPLTLHRVSGKAAAVAFDGGGGAWTEGTRVSLHIAGAPSDIRAYGPGGRRLAVTVNGNTITLGKPLAAGLRALPALPNPFRAATDIRFSMDAPGEVGITVFDLQGRKVSEVAPRVYEAGVHTVSWTARDLTGRRLPAGLYLGRVQWGGRRASVRLVNLGG